MDDKFVAAVAVVAPASVKAAPDSEFTEHIAPLPTITPLNPPSVPLEYATEALATGADITERTPAVNADTATTAMRCFIVFLDICFLSLVKLGNFPISARRSFDPLIPSSLAHTCNANEAGNLVIQ